MPMSALEANALIIRVYRHLQKPIQNGMALRQEMMSAIKAGKIPEGYRYPYFSEVAAFICENLKDAAHQFSLEHPTDQLSIEDLKDILAFAAKLLSK